jgi:hypothetical protein
MCIRQLDHFSYPRSCHALLTGMVQISGLGDCGTAAPGLCYAHGSLQGRKVCSGQSAYAEADTIAGYLVWRQNESIKPVDTVSG